MGIRADDPIWILVLGVRQAEQAKAWAGQAAEAAGEAADRIRDEIRGLPDKLKEGAVAGAQEVKIAIAQAGKEIGTVWAMAGGEIQKRVAQSIQSEADNFTKKIGAAAEVKKAEVVQDWQAALAGAVKNHGRTEFTKSVIFTVAALLILIFGACYLSFEQGERGGEATGLKIGGNFRIFTDCNLPGWKIEKDQSGNPWCIPYPDTGNGRTITHGWRLK